MSETHRILQPEAWPRPSGYSNGIVAEGTAVYVAGQIGWDATTGRVVEGMAAQVEQALRNIVSVLAEASASPTDIARLTWFVTNMELYRQETKAIGQGYRRVMGRHFPAMSVIGVHCLVERGALVEIEATAVLPT
ncbi:MAG TPA: RidA family protein [Acetobacteraceae bacterium]|jgi:enamine deaminase RidA (YjgF/YER057c/UK114 family)|nr:RidA family protein [Acetobacteraceae bacterium]